jgi:hypothetical protein
MRSFPTLGRVRPVRAGTVALAAMLLLPLSLTGAPAHAASMINVTTVVTTDVRYSGAVGATVSVIHLCPAQAVLDRSLTRNLNAFSDAQHSPLSREMWPRGMVTRWRVGPATELDSGFEQSVACRESIPAGSRQHTAKVMAISRLWGPTPVGAWLWSQHQARSTWGGHSTISDTQPSTVRVRRMREVLTESAFSEFAFASGDVSGRLPAGRYSEARTRLTVTSRPGRTRELDNVHVPDFTVPRLGGGHLAWSAYRGRSVVVAVGPPARVASAVRRLLQVGAPRQKVIGLVHDLFSKDKFRPTPLPVIERRTGDLPVRVGYAQVPDAWDTAGVIAFVDATGTVIRYLPSDASDAQLKSWIRELR